MIIGREYEQQRLLDFFKSEYSEFVAVYGRRRIGKTYLVKETFDYKFSFQHTGVQGGDKTRQLSEFAQSLKNAGAAVVRRLKDWFEAFHALEDLLSKLPDGKKVVFIDELPWMDTQKSGFVSALEHFWNGWATMRKDILLVVCGSAASWIVSKIVRNYGGLHNRLSAQLYLKPFTLHECELYVQSREINMTRRQILETYMVLGGVPYYWSFLQRRFTYSQNIDNMFFADGAELSGEFDALYASLFKNPSPYVDLVTLLGKKKIGMTRNEIVKNFGRDTGGTLTAVLRDLEQCGFLRAYNSIGKSAKDTVYQLIDNFTLFYFKFMQENRRHDPQFWSHSVSKQFYAVWSGLAFERVCMQHTSQIKRALGISGVVSSDYSWVYRPQSADETGVQIDLLIDRDDDTINLCEMKFTKDKYEITKQYSEALRRKVSVFEQKSGSKKSVFPVMITVYGLLRNAYADDILHQVVMDDLFEKG